MAVPLLSQQVQGFVKRNRSAGLVDDGYKETYGKLAQWSEYNNLEQAISKAIKNGKNPDHAVGCPGYVVEDGRIVVVVTTRGLLRNFVKSSQLGDLLGYPGASLLLLLLL